MPADAPAPAASDAAVETECRPLRADAQRNRDRIVEAARTAFRERGADCSLDEIGKRAGVGAGTLYRHFPTRDALIDAVMRDWVERIEADSRSVAEAGGPPREALAGWFSRFIENVGIYHGAAAKLMSAMDDPRHPIFRKCQVLFAANEMVLDSFSDALRDDVDADQVMRLISGISATIDRTGCEPTAAAGMLRIVLDGILRPEAE